MSDEEYLYTLFITVYVTHPAHDNLGLNTFYQCQSVKQHCIMLELCIYPYKIQWIWKLKFINTMRAIEEKARTLSFEIKSNMKPFLRTQMSLNTWVTNNSFCFVFSFLKPSVGNNESALVKPVKK